MTCDDCAERVTDALESLPGVRQATVSLSGRSALVEASPDVEGGVLALAVRDAGPPAGHRYNAFERRRRASVGAAEEAHGD
jgi:copper chaperone CopZ